MTPLDYDLTIKMQRSKRLHYGRLVVAVAQRLKERFAVADVVGWVVPQ